MAKTKAAKTTLACMKDLKLVDIEGKCSLKSEMIPSTPAAITLI